MRSLVVVSINKVIELCLLQALFPAPIRQVLTDNGSEFLGAFDQYAQQQGWRHCHTYPRCPKMNAYNERFNRTIQEEFVDYREDLLLDDLRGFNATIYWNTYSATTANARIGDWITVYSNPKMSLKGVPF